MALYIRGVQVKEPAKGGVHITDEPVWGENTARDVNSALMIGDIVARKILDQIKVQGSNPFYKIRYNDESADSLTEITVYSGNLQRAVESISNAYRKQTGATVTFIER